MDWTSLALGDLWLSILTALILLEDLEVVDMTPVLMLSATSDHM